jgi:hypothetical protein
MENEVGSSVAACMHASMVRKSNRRYFHDHIHHALHRGMNSTQGPCEHCK